MSGRQPRPLIAGNWKMNGLMKDLQVIETVSDRAAEGDLLADIIICPPAHLIAPALAATGGRSVRIGAQDCHPGASGAHTGDISAEMIADAGATAVIVGHSERRADHGETDVLVAQKVDACHRAGLIAIVCVGETAGQRNAGLTEAVVLRQLASSVPKASNASNTVIAYEPVWAIGSGLVATPEAIARTHAAVRQALADRFADGSNIRILYGGSVKPDNASEILGIENVNGALVGGASLKAEDFLGIISACR